MKRGVVSLILCAMPLCHAACVSSSRANKKSATAPSPRVQPAAAAPTPRSAPPANKAGLLPGPPKTVTVEKMEEVDIVVEETAPAAKAPPDPHTLVASIGPTTSPQRAASLRLTVEGRRLLEAGDSAAALDRFEKAVKVDPSNPHGYYALAEVHLQRGRLDQALAFADKSVVLFSASDREWLTQAYTFRATVLERAGRFREARDSYRSAVRAEPGNVAARAGLVRLGEPDTGDDP